MFARTISSWLTPPVSPWRVILLATMPFWAYLTLHDIAIYESYVLGGTPREIMKLMLKSLFSINLYYDESSSAKFLRTTLLVLSLLNFLTSSFIYSKSDVLTDKGDNPAHTFIDSDLTSPGKLFVIQNETLRINENLKVQPLYLMNAALLLKTDLQKKYFSEILTSEDKIFLSYVFIESIQPRSPPLSLS